MSGAVGQPGVFYVGLPAGGVWKTTSAGETWYPVFDSIKTVSSVGAVEVAPSDPNVIYVGTGDMVTGGGINEGNGVYKSTDAGPTWQHSGSTRRSRSRRSSSIRDDPNLVMIAAQGNIHQRSDARGVFRSTDGGRTWTKTLLRRRSDRHPEDRLGVRQAERHVRDDRSALRRAGRSAASWRRAPTRDAPARHSTSRPTKASPGRRSPVAACRGSPAAPPSPSQ